MKWIVLFTITLSLITLSCSKTGSDISGDEPDKVEYAVSLKTDSIAYNNHKHDFIVSFTNNPEVTSIDFYIDGELEKSIFEQPFSYTTTLKDIATGEHTINIIAKLQDGKLLKDEKKIVFKVKYKDEYQGGVVVYTSDELHGVIVAKKDLQGGVLNKFQYGNIRGNYKSYSTDNGYENTRKFKGITNTNYAAVACLNYEVGGYKDWYLPAIEEFEYLKGFEESLSLDLSNHIYWSSTLRVDDTHAEVIFFGRAAVSTPDLELQNYHFVRPFRKF